MITRRNLFKTLIGGLAALFVGSSMNAESVKITEAAVISYNASEISNTGCCYWACVIDGEERHYYHSFDGNNWKEGQLFGEQE